jgi:putative ATP-dependent endonuclease of OLD family
VPFGTLLDIVLTLQQVQAAGMWENLLAQLRALGCATEGHAELRRVLDGIEERVQQFIPLVARGKATGFHVTNLTRKDLREAVSLFLTCDPSIAAVPFERSGSGTLNVLVLAMLTFIADLKQSFIFAMEEPEIAIPPYTQRRIVGMLRTKAQQCIVTSHSPYVGECFLPDELVVLRRSADQELVGTPVRLGAEIKRKMFRREFRTRLYPPSHRTCPRKRLRCLSRPLAAESRSLATRWPRRDSSLCSR